MSARIHFCGPARYRLRGMEQLGESILETSTRRLLKGPQRPSWNWFVEVATRVLKKRVNTAFKMRDVREARRFLDSVVIGSPALSEVSLRYIVRDKFKGIWFSGKNAEPSVTLLYFHGGGYSFYPQAYTTFIAEVTLAANARTFAVDYRLSPEHRFPAQLEDALNAYRWLLANGSDPDRLVIAGDSAGGNLTLALLLQARDENLPPPALAIALSPPTSFDGEILGSEENDWIDRRALFQWRDWFCDPAQRRNPLVSPLGADLRGLPPIYIQAGRAEILYDSIQAFVDHGKSQGADVVLESWEDMNHVFQIFGPYALQSAEALRRMGDVVDIRVRGLEKTGGGILQLPSQLR
jgi:epsilon-lactone hydrolase